MKELNKYFNGEIIINKDTLKSLKTKYINSKLNSKKVNIDKPFGIVALVDNYLNTFKVVTFHYIDFRWYSIRLSAKIMHKSNIEEWKGTNGFSYNFSKSPMRYSGDVCGVMYGDFRECFDIIKENEEKHQLLYHENFAFSSKEKINIKIKCGIGLESLTIIEKWGKGSHKSLGIFYIE